MKKRTKRFADGGLNDEPPIDPSGSGTSGGMPPLKPRSRKDDTYYDKLQNFYLDNTSSALRNKRIPDLTLKDLADVPKTAALTAGLIPAIPVAGFADEIVRGKKGYDAYKQKQLRDDIADLEDEAVGRAPPVALPFKKQPLTKDQIAGKEKVESLRRTYGPSQDERDRMARNGMKKGGKVKAMAKGGSVSSASNRADGCASKGKTKGRFV
jgi:hypothetical protein